MDHLLYIKLIGLFQNLHNEKLQAKTKLHFTTLPLDMNVAPGIAQFGLVIAGRPVITDFRCVILLPPTSCGRKRPPVAEPPAL